MKTKTYSELIKLGTFYDRFEYLKLSEKIGEETFGFERYLNQGFYRSQEWKMSRDFVIARDLGCDLAISDREIHGKIVVHHMNPITIDAIKNGSPIILDPEFLITCSHNTHNAIHYGSIELLIEQYAERSPNDTTPWR